MFLLDGESKETEMATCTPRVTSLTKREGQSFGFMLRIELGEEGHLIRNLDKGGLAELAGLRDGDRILRVNGTFVDNLEHIMVVKMVKDSGASVALHVLDHISYKQAKASGIDLSDARAHPSVNGVAAPGLKPKLCFLKKGKHGYGFTLRSKQGEEGVFVDSLTPSGAAAKAGLKPHDRVLEVNGDSVENTTNKQIMKKVKEGGRSLMLLLADEETHEHYRNKKMKLEVGRATTKYLPTKPRIIDMEAGSGGYGYYLRSDPKLQGHFIKDIDKGSPAERGGLKNMDWLVAVDGVEVAQWNHDNVVERIRQCGVKCSLLVVDTETNNMYKLGGASPFLYWEEMRGSLPQPTPPASPKAAAKPITALPANDPAKPSGGDYKPKLCKLEKRPSGYGFHLTGVQGEISQNAIKEVVKGGAADMAGLEDSDIVVEVDGVNIENKTYEQVVDMIRASEDSLVLLVAEERAYDHFKDKGIPITTLLLSQAKLNTPHTPTRLKKVKEEEEEKEQKKEVKKEEKKEEEVSRPATPTILAKARDRKSSAASSSSSSVDEQL